MKITTFNPQIMTKDAEPVVKLFEEMGFERRHKKDDMRDYGVTGIRMRDENGFHLDISQADALPVDSLASIRMNVDDFDEAYQLLLSRGFKNFYGDRFVETPSAKSAVMLAPTGFTINLVKHVRKEDRA